MDKDYDKCKTDINKVCDDCCKCDDQCIFNKYYECTNCHKCVDNSNKEILNANIEETDDE